MKRLFWTASWVVVLVGSVLLIAGCDEGGVYNIVGGSLELAYGIVDVAT
jgi:hypothetical protein